MRELLQVRVRALVLPTLLVFPAACDDGLETRTFTLQYMEPEQAQAMIEPYVRDAEGSLRVTKQPPSLTVTAPGLRLEQIAEVLAANDRVQPDVQLRFQVIEADGFTEADPAIADVQQALQELFRFSGYRLVAEAVVRSKAPGYVQQRIVARDDQVYTLTAELERVLMAESGRAVELNVDLRYERGAGGQTMAGSLITTSLTLPSGQTVVIGSARAQAGANTLILVVRPVIP